jgi:hypothetical protein
VVVVVRVVARVAVIVEIVAKSVKKDIVARRKETNEARISSIETIEMKIMVEMTSVNTETRIKRTRKTMTMIKKILFHILKF